MLHPRLLVTPTLLLAVLAIPRSASAQEPRPLVAILDVDTTASGPLRPAPELGAAMAELLVDRLVASGRYRVMDRLWMNSAAGGEEPAGPAFDQVRARAQTAGVDYLIAASLVRYTTEKKRRTYGALVPVPFIGGVRGGGTEMAIAVTVRAIDVRSGEVAATAIGEGRRKRRNISLAGLGLAHAAGGLMSLSSDGRAALVAEAAEQAIDNAARSLIASASRLASGGSSQPGGSSMTMK